MTLSLASVKYIGPAMQTRLELNGITTVEQLAAMTVQELADVPGIGATTAIGILESAKALNAKGESDPTPEVTTAAAITEDNTEPAVSTADTATVSTEMKETEAEAKLAVKPKTPAVKRPSRAKTAIPKKTEPEAKSTASATTAKVVPKSASTRSRVKKPVTSAAKATDKLPEAKPDDTIKPESTVKVLKESVKKEANSQKAKKSAKAEKEQAKHESKVKREAEKQLKKAKKVVEKERKKEAKALKKIAEKEKKEKKLADKAAKKIVKKAKKAAKSAGAKVE